MHTETGSALEIETSTAEERWVAWVARNVEQDRKARKRAIAVATIVGIGLMVWLASGVLLG
jgi:hypothetical protein